MDTLWNIIKKNLKETLSAPGYQTFISSATPLSYENQVLKLSVPNQFSKDWIKQKCEDHIQTLVHKETNTSIIIDYSIKPEKREIETEQLPIFEQKPTPSSSKTHFNKDYTFENFVVGHNNRFAYAASEAVAKAPAKAYNPLFIYGSVGLGKTHLLHAIALRVLDAYPKLTVKLVSSEKFTNDLINSIKDKKTEQFRAKYRKVDVLIVDDIQFLAGKEQTQEEFFHTFNELRTCNKQIILTSDRPPKEIPTLEIRLRTRFEWGLIADLQPPEFETRIAILRKKNEFHQFHISDDILHFIATQIPSNVREMEGAINRIVAYASLLNTEITLSIASNVIRDMIGHKQEKPITISLIKEKSCEFFSITEIELCSKNRTKELAYARQLSMYLSRELTQVSLPKIGQSFGNRDHSTVMHACDKIKNLIASNDNTKNMVNNLITAIKNEN